MLLIEESHVILPYAKTQKEDYRSVEQNAQLYGRVLPAQTKGDVQQRRASPELLSNN